MAAPNAFYYGIAFPFGKSAVALPAPAVDNDLIKQSLEQIIKTGKTERVMRPDFGSGALRFVFENNNELLNELVRAEITSSVGRWEPRVVLQDIQIQNDTDYAQVIITLFYVLVATRQQDTVAIVVPTG